MTNDATPTQDQAPVPTERRGTLGLGADGEWQIRFERRLRHSPERVWAVLTDPEQQAVWAPGVRIDATVGGTAVFDFGDDGRARGEVLAVDPPHRLEHTWIWPGEPYATVRWDITVDGDETVLTMLHRPLRHEPATVFSAGWHGMLDTMEVLMERGELGGYAPDYEQLFPIYAAAGE